MASILEIVKRAARAASGTRSPQLYILGIISAILALLILYEIIRTIKLTGSIWKNITSRFRILILTSCFLEITLTSIVSLVSFNWKSVFLIIFFYTTLPTFLQFCTFSFYILYLAKTLFMIEGKQTKLKKYLDLIFVISIIVYFILLIILDYFTAKNVNEGKDNSTSNLLSALYIIIFIFPLVILFVIMGVKYYRKFKDYLLVSIQKERIKYIMILIIINGVIFTIFFIYALFGAFEKNKISDTVGTYLANEEYSKYDTYALIFTLVFGLIPAFVLFIILHRILSIEKGMFQRQENILLAGDDNNEYLNNEYKLFDVKN
ncbi:hypothetical protein M0811_00707 [Anaeramoeba ignava]|uniref:Uncharacterized protein n=1 Tax=Anaeramoeba ignava TaxID=1746090 RepID=A0A9Q0RBG3_ANAIG|nr:hypothetical protein M0811_00707 [Anaeramoeba ignava]